MLKWLLVGVFSFLAIGVTIIAFNYNKIDEGNVRAVQEVEAALQSANIGLIRDGASPTISKKEIVANMVKEVAETQKNSGNDIKIKYVFLDEKDNVTNDESNINSVQFQINLINDDGETISVAESKLSLKEVYNG